MVRYLKRLLQGLARLRTTPISRLGAIFEAAVYLAIAQVLTKSVSYARWSRLLGPLQADGGHDASVGDEKLALEIGRAVEIAARYVPWRAVCLPQAMAAKWMLRRRHVPHTLFVGISRDRRASGQRRSEQDWLLHAWLLVGDRVVTGGNSTDDFKVIARYA